MDISEVVNAMGAIDDARVDLEKALNAIRDDPNSVIAARCYMIEKKVDHRVSAISKLLIAFMLGIDYKELSS